MKRFVLVFFSITILGSASSVSAENLKMCYESWEPFHYQEEGRHAGIQIEIVDRALQSLGHSVTYNLLPYARCIKEVENGTYDAILLTFAENTLVSATVTPVFWEMGFVARSDLGIDSYSSLDVFHGKKAGLVESYEYGEEITEISKKWKVEPANNALTNLRKLSVGRIDFTLADLPWSAIMARKEGLNLQFLSPTFMSSPQYIHFNKTKTAYVEPISNAIQTLIDDGTVSELYQRFLGLTYEQILKRNKSTFIPADLSN